MTKFTWTIKTLWTQTIAEEKNYVVTAAFELAGIDGDYKGAINRTIKFSTENIKPPFIAYEELTEDIVVGWIKDQLGADSINILKNLAQVQIDSRKDPKSLPQPTELPWVTK